MNKRSLFEQCYLFYFKILLIYCIISSKQYQQVSFWVSNITVFQFPWYRLFILKYLDESIRNAHRPYVQPSPHVLPYPLCYLPPLAPVIGSTLSVFLLPSFLSTVDLSCFSFYFLFYLLRFCKIFFDSIFSPIFRHAPSLALPNHLFFVFTIWTVHPTRKVPLP